jgi:hypothetical protein
MYGGIKYGLLNMTADIYKQQNVQDPESGAIKREWVYWKRIPIHIDIISTEGTSISDNYKSFTEQYNEVEKIKMKSVELLSKRYRVTNIVNKSGEKLFVENDQIDSPSTIFDIESHHPRLDPLGNVLFYESNLRRSQVQSNE